MGNYKWNTNDSDKNLPFVVVLMISRNKDNQNVEGFKERRKSFLCHKDMKYIMRKFNHFVNDGVKGEFCRLYVSVNARNVDNVRKELITTLVYKEDINFDYIESIVAGIAAKKENAAESKWMFDFDSSDNDQLTAFLDDIGDLVDEVYPTPHGFAVTTKEGFDTRELMRKWANIVTLKRDDLVCVNWKTTGDFYAQ